MQEEECGIESKLRLFSLIKKGVLSQSVKVAKECCVRLLKTVIICHGMIEFWFSQAITEVYKISGRIIAAIGINSRETSIHPIKHEQSDKSIIHQE